MKLIDKYDLIGAATLFCLAIIIVIIYNIIYNKKNEIKSPDWKGRVEQERKKFKKFEAVFMIIGAIIMIAIPVVTIKYLESNPNKPAKKTEFQSTDNYDAEREFENTLDYKMLIETKNRRKGQNFLISPYSMTIALEMLRDGAKNETRLEIDEMLNGIEHINQINIKNRVATSNGLFIKEKYKNEISDSYYNLIKNNYGGEILYDKFESPKIINDWIAKSTNEMIKNPIESIDPNFVLGIFNALAIDVEWAHQFDCNSTTEETFEAETTFNVEMMHQEYDHNAKYYETNYSKGVILPYKTYDEDGNEAKEGKTLEFIGILPNVKLDDYIEIDFLKEYLKLDKVAKAVSEEVRLELALPRFEYDYSFDDFAEALQAEGITSAFSDEANFKNISENVDMKVGSAIHKTYIKLGETGTKAAAVTGFAMVGNAYMPEDYEKFEIEFNKPFLYIIRDSNTKKILFIGGVDKPNIWNGSTCEK